ncbi:MAG: arsenate reductase ArsC [Gammaproteobacteria bacterium]
MNENKEILFLCTGNSCRSQMAEGLTRHYWGEHFTISSAGIEKHGMNPLAIKAMQEINIDLSGHRSKTVNELENPTPDYLITVCGHANESCPVFEGTVKRLHAGFDDPPKLAAEATSEEEAMPHYRRVRDEIEAFVKQLPDKWLARAV